MSREGFATSRCGADLVAVAPVVALAVAAVVGGSVAARAQGEAPAVVFDEDLSDDGTDFMLLPFEVGAGAQEIEVRHQSLGDGDVIDFGVDDPNGFRGWGGGNDEPAIVGVDAASRSYLPGPLPAGTWSVVVGKAKIVSGAPHVVVEVFVRDTPTLASATNRGTPTPVTLSSGARFYAGDLHVHSEDSGDARPGLAEISTASSVKGLDFVVITDHNTTSQLERIAFEQPAIDNVLLVPGMEFTTYGGHMNAFGVSAPVDQKLGLTTTLDDVVADFRAQGAFISINHPNLDLGDVCIGCAWVHDVPDVDAVEIATGGYDQSGFIFGEGARDFWDAHLDGGSHAAPVGGSDDHRAGVDVPAFGSPLGDPTTMIFASSLSTAALLQGIRDNRTVVKLQGPDDPMIELETVPARVEREGRVDTVVVAPGEGAQLSIRVTGGAGSTLRVLKDGRPGATTDELAVDGDDVSFDVDVNGPEDVGDAAVRYRAEVLVEGVPRTVTGHVWVIAEDAVVDGCGGCAASSEADALVYGVGAMGLLLRRRRKG